MPASHGPSTLSMPPSQSSSAGSGITPMSLGCVMTTSIAPGFALGSQSLQSPVDGVHPSPSASSFGPLMHSSIGAPVLPPMSNFGRFEGPLSLLESDGTASPLSASAPAPSLLLLSPPPLEVPPPGF